MPSHRSTAPTHRAWIEQARLQSDEVDRQVAEINSARTASDAEVLRADSFPGYALEREIHRGAQGVVYRAVQQSTGRRVALKLLHDQALGGLLERARFEREMRILAALRHPNIVTIHDGGSHDGRFFLVMDYIAGQSVDLYMASRPHSLRETLELFVQICDAVNSAHVRGIIHRDIKPGNVRVDESGRPFVLDFGLAKMTAVAPGESIARDSTAARTLTGQFLGSLPWAAPEQVAAHPGQIDTRTDVYSLGVLLFQMLTAKFPYPATGPLKEATEAILHAAPLSPRAIRREIDDDLETIVLKCLSKERDRRYQTAGELASDVRRYVDGEPIVGRPASRTYQLRKFAKRNMGLVGGIAAAFAVLLIAIAGISIALVRATRAERAAVQSAARATAVSKFLQNMLAGVDPEDIGPDALTVRQVLDHAAARLEIELIDQHEIAAPVHQTLGDHYNTLGLYFDADRHFRKAVELRRIFAPGDGLELAEALGRLAANLHDKRDLPDAEAPMREALELRRRLLGQESLEVAESLHDLAALLIDRGRACDAEPLARESLGIRRQLLGTEHVLVALGTGTLGGALLALGRMDEAESALRDAVEMVRRLPGDNESMLAGRLTFLSRVLRARGKYAEEEMVVREAIAIRTRRLAPDHPALGWNLFCLAQVRWRLGDLGEAETACRKAHDIFTKKRGPLHEDIANCQQLLAQIYDDQGRLAEAEALWSACVEMRRKLLPPEDPRTAFAEDALLKNRAAQAGLLEVPIQSSPP